ncbi:hypothetical protein EV209_2120 [Cuneatibacter caecimuris]|uniref:Uncharacterized protein n=1 Tax=Cuneatibacter caecimuris TaxID=1796618 RepID=A0A4Q7P4B6_9FIRM|nr:hypothetical protein EV209_2120 [Cuneatibacter caecimuris]
MRCCQKSLAERRQKDAGGTMPDGHSLPRLFLLFYTENFNLFPAGPLCRDRILR